MPDPTPQQLSDRMDGLEKRIVALEEDDAKVHGLIQWINDKIISNPKMSAAIAALAGMALTAIGAWWAARNNSMPGVVSEPTPVVKPADAPKTVNKVDLDTIQKSLKEQSK